MEGNKISMRDKRGYGLDVEFDGNTYLLLDQPYLDGGCDRAPCYTVNALRVGDTLDENNEVEEYTLTWKINPDYDPAMQEEEDACDWEHPATVEPAGDKFYYNPQERQQRRTAWAIEDAFRALDLQFDTSIKVKEKEFGETCLSISVHGAQKNEFYDLPDHCCTVSDVASQMYDKYWEYDINEERYQYPSGEYGIPDEPYLTDDLRYIRKTYGRISEACEAAKRVEKGENPEKVYPEYRQAWAKEDRRACRQECWNLMYRMSKLYDHSFEETMAVINQNYAKLSHGRLRMKQSDPAAIRDDLLHDFRKLAEGYQSLYGVSDKDMQNAMKEVSKKLPDFAGKKPREDGGR